MENGKATPQNPLISTALKNHFGTSELHGLVTSIRNFPATARLDLQSALTEVLSGPLEPKKVLGAHAAYSHETVTFSHLIVERDNTAVLIAPLQYDEMDTGGPMPVRCLKNALWLCCDDTFPFAIFLTRIQNFGRSTGLHLEVAVMPGEKGLELSRRLLEQIDRKINQAGSYRGKVLSLEASDNYSGAVGGIKVHRLKSVIRDEVILPAKTLALLERNVTRFIEQRDKLKAMWLGIKKGLLFYGPPGTGKTHTIHYLASQMKDHTTLLITAEQVGLLDHYVQLARFLQPSMVVIEDVDLIARDRTSMRNACEESILNRLLNEMDGLREDAKVLFILTTNRPGQLEGALTSRPGRIDQAIEFPLPDDLGRRKLIQLYAGGLKISDKLLLFLVEKTNGGSGAFIKELMRRSAQFQLEAGEQDLTSEFVESALDEMLFSGGSLNAKLLGFAQK
jgi:ATPase family associated with various cellular activities (AAA)